MGSRSRSSNSSATTTNARQYTATDDAIIGNGNSRSETIDASVDNRVQLDDRSITTTTINDTSDNSVHIEQLSDDVALAAIDSSAQLAARALQEASDRAFRAEARESAAARTFAQESVKRDSQLTQFIADQNKATGDFVGEIVATSTGTVAGVTATAAEALEENKQLLIYGGVGAAALVVVSLFLRR